MLKWVQFLIGNKRHFCLLKDPAEVETFIGVRRRRLRLRRGTRKDIKGFLPDGRRCFKALPLQAAPRLELIAVEAELASGQSVQRYYDPVIPLSRPADFTVGDARDAAATLIERAPAVLLPSPEKN